MSTSRYDELVSQCLDGEPSEEELNELAELLKKDESLALDFKDQLITWEAWSQETAPERSPDAFFAGIETRVRAEKDAPAFELSVTKKLKQRRLPMPFHPIIAVAATAALMLIFVQIMMSSSKEGAESAVLAANHICVSGECVCTRCTLHQTEDHLRAVRYRGEDGKTETVLLKNNPEMKMHMHHFCKGPTPVLVEGNLNEENGELVLTATAYKAFITGTESSKTPAKEAQTAIAANAPIRVAINN